MMATRSTYSCNVWLLRGDLFDTKYVYGWLAKAFCLCDAVRYTDKNREAGVFGEALSG